jgi:hypothetical protein
LLRLYAEILQASWSDAFRSGVGTPVESTELLKPEMTAPERDPENPRFPKICSVP